MILVVGATGVLGLQICRLLRERGLPVRALARGTSSATEELARLGVAVAKGDLKDPASLRAACEGVSTVITTATATSRHGPGESMRLVDRDGQLSLLEAAGAAGVRRYVYVSVSPNFRSTCELIRIKRQVEREVRGSGLEWVILQPPAFQEIWLSPIVGFDFRAGKVRMIGPGTERTSLVSIGDVARVAVEAALRPELARKDLAFGGPHALPLNDVVKMAEELTGRRFQVRRLPLPLAKALCAVLTRFQPTQGSLISLGIELGERGDVLDSSDLYRQLGISPTSVRDYLARATGTGSAAGTRPI